MLFIRSASIEGLMITLINNPFWEQPKKGLLFSILGKTIPHKSAVLSFGFGLLKGMMSINIASRDLSIYFSLNPPRSSHHRIPSF